MRRVALVGAAMLLLGAVVAGAVLWWAMRPGPAAVVRTEIPTGGGVALNLAGPANDIALTPDGSTIVYRGIGQLLVRGLDRLDPTALSGVGIPYDLVVSPDGQWIGFFDGSLLKKVAITGGPAVTITRLDGVGRGATWADDDTIVFATFGQAVGLQRVPSAGSEAPTVLTKPNREEDEGDHALPQLLPGGRAVLFTVTPLAATDDPQIAVLDLRTGTQKILIRGGSAAHGAGARVPLPAAVAGRHPDCAGSRGCGWHDGRDRRHLDLGYPPQRADPAHVQSGARLVSRVDAGRTAGDLRCRTGR